MDACGEVLLSLQPDSSLCSFCSKSPQMCNEDLIFSSIVLKNRNYSNKLCLGEAGAYLVVYNVFLTLEEKMNCRERKTVASW